MQKSVDLLIIGGGINGAGIAADAAGRGLSVMVCDKSDFGSATSSASSKLIHGGLRYLEQYAFKFVRESLKERDLLLKLAPHLVKPLQFIIPHNPKLRQLWMMKLGLFIYDHLGASRHLPGSSSMPLSRDTEKNPLCLSLKNALTYYDAKVDDSRLVISNLIAAKERGALVYSRASLSQFEQIQDGWQVQCQLANGQPMQVNAKVCVNATGPWAQGFLDQNFGFKSSCQLRCIKGSHIIVPKLYQHDSAYLLQHFDGRAVFVIPYQKQFTMIGTTDVEYHSLPEQATCSQDEIQYLVDIVSKYFHHPLKKENIVHHWSGVRPLVGEATHNPSTISREHKLELLGDKAKVLNVFGGKLTTYRKLSEQAVDLLKPLFKHMKPCQTHVRPLPGGDIPKRDLKGFHKACCEQFPYIKKQVISRYISQYGTRILALLNGCHNEADLGQLFGHGLYERELQYLCEHEWAQSIEDVIWRRTKLGYFLTHEQIAAAEQFMLNYQVESDKQNLSA